MIGYLAKLSCPDCGGVLAHHRGDVNEDHAGAMAVALCDQCKTGWLVTVTVRPINAARAWRSAHAEPERRVYA